MPQVAETTSASDADAAREALRAAIQSIGNGDRAALDEVYHATSRKLFGICYRILGDRKEAEDALQDTYVTLWRRAERFDTTRASPISWLAVMARNAAVDRLRSSGRKLREGAVPMEAALDRPDGAPDAERTLLQGEERARIHDCIRALDSRQRSTIARAFFGGQTYAALAERDGLPLSTVKSRVRRGLAQLRICLEAGA